MAAALTPSPPDNQARGRRTGEAGPGQLPEPARPPGSGKARRRVCPEPAAAASSPPAHRARGGRTRGAGPAACRRARAGKPPFGSDPERASAQSDSVRPTSRRPRATQTHSPRAVAPPTSALARCPCTRPREPVRCPDQPPRRCNPAHATEAPPCRTLHAGVCTADTRRHRRPERNRLHARSSPRGPARRPHPHPARLRPRTPLPTAASTELTPGPAPTRHPAPRSAAQPSDRRPAERGSRGRGWAHAPANPRRPGSAHSARPRTRHRRPDPANPPARTTPASPSPTDPHPAYRPQTPNPRPSRPTRGTAPPALTPPHTAENAERPRSRRRPSTPRELTRPRNHARIAPPPPTCPTDKPPANPRRPRLGPARHAPARNAERPPARGTTPTSHHPTDPRAPPRQPAHEPAERLPPHPPETPNARRWPGGRSSAVRLVSASSCATHAGRGGVRRGCRPAPG